MPERAMTTVSMAPIIKNGQGDISGFRLRVERKRDGQEIVDLTIPAAEFTRLLAGQWANAEGTIPRVIHS